MSLPVLKNSVRGPTSSTYTFFYNGEETTISGCASWTPEEAAKYLVNRGAVGKALAACVIAGDNFIADSFRESFPEDYARIQAAKT